MAPLTDINARTGRAICSAEGCTSQVRKRGLCGKHGGRDICRAPDCKRIARGKLKLCFAHLPQRLKPKCANAGCERAPQVSGKLCNKCSGRKSTKLFKLSGELDFGSPRDGSFSSDEFDVRTDCSIPSSPAESFFTTSEDDDSVYNVPISVPQIMHYGPVPIPHDGDSVWYPSASVQPIGYMIEPSEFGNASEIAMLQRILSVPTSAQPLNDDRLFRMATPLAPEEPIMQIRLPMEYSMGYSNGPVYFDQTYTMQPQAPQAYSPVQYAVDASLMDDLDFVMSAVRGMKIKDGSEEQTTRPLKKEPGEIVIEESSKSESVSDVCRSIVVDVVVMSVETAKSIKRSPETHQKANDEMSRSPELAFAICEAVVLELIDFCTRSSDGESNSLHKNCSDSKKNSLASMCTPAVSVHG